MRYSKIIEQHVDRLTKQAKDIMTPNPNIKIIHGKAGGSASVT